ncbi:hypothetical protein ACSDQ9_00530 [Aestuariimicrobium soli]|uniref:WXG100-like domain-containing protein n=1 Tax=Aestuariimicrobium soli TaxID=2035834 RepID=UPI003EC08C61
MAVMLPAEASKLLNELGYEWPEGNEDRVFDYGQRWMSYASEVGGVNQIADEGANEALTKNMGDAMEAFRTEFSEEEGVRDVAQKLSLGANILGGCMFLVGAAIIALKIAFVVNLVATVIQIASAIAAAIPTCGASLGWIPVAKILCQKLLEMAINFGISKLMGA